MIRADRAAVIGTLCRGLTHDLRNPLQALAFAARADLVLPDETGPPVWLEVQQAVGSLARTIDHFSRLYAPVNSEPGPVVLADLFALLSELQGYQRSLAETDFQLRIAHGLPAVFAVHDDLLHAFLSLVVNAKEALRGRQTPRIRITAQAEGSGVRVLVEDNGPGFAGGEHERPFATYFTTKPGALGLGLPVARRLVQSRGGSLYAEPAEGSGARLVARLARWEGTTLSR